MVDNELMSKLLELDSAPGNEVHVAKFLLTQYKPLADEIVYDNLGSIYAVRRSKQVNAAHVMVSGHMDEPGLILKSFNENGTLNALILGELAEPALLGTAIRFNVAGHHIQGTLLSLTEKPNAVSNKQTVLVDCGFTSQEAAENSGLTIGAHATFAQAPVMGEQRVIAKNWDGRFAPLVGLALLEAVKDEQLDFDLYVGCTVQETVGLRGVQTATNVVEPDLGIVIDTDAAFDYQDDARDKIGVLGAGLLVNFYDKTVLPNRMLIQELKAICTQNNIPYQYYYSMAGSDAAWINKLRTGTPTLFINAAVRNLGTPSQVIDLNDIAAVQQALIAFIHQLTPAKIAAYKAENR